MYYLKLVKQSRSFLGVFLMVILFSSSLYSAAPVIDPADDQQYLGVAENILFWTPHEQVAGYRNIEKIRWSRRVKAGKTVLELPENKQDLSELLISAKHKNLSLNEYLTHGDVAGLLVLKEGEVVVEYYGLGNTRDSRWTSFSVAKSVTSLLVGAAIQDGYINSTEEKIAQYLPRLDGSAYSNVTIRNAMQMSSGVEWNENYNDPESDVASVSWETLSLIKKLGGQSRVAEPGAAFNYNTAETNMVGTLLRSAIGNNLATYLSEKIWKPFGMEADAYWSLTEKGGGEFGGCCLSATLRDYGRIGLFVLANGQLLYGTSILPESWIEESTSPSQAYPSYGYFWWLLPNGDFRASGIFGQAIYINPKENIVIALHSARARATHPEDSSLQQAMFNAIAAALRD